MTTTKFEIRAGAYYDSVVLMQLQRSLAALEGIADAGVVMATAANCELLADGGLLPEAASSAGPDDLLIVVKGAAEGAAEAALGQVDELLARRRSAAVGAFRPRSLEMAARALPEARWVLVSVPGRYAAGVARQALDLGRNVFLYSDNVSIEAETALKREAFEKGLLVMGPDCGTAIVNGVGLGFANRVRRGPIGLVGASGTGLQAVTAAIHNQGSGISQAIGTGGRDLKKDIGGITAFQALDLLARDPETKVIVLVSKPPEARVAGALLSAARRIGKPVVVNFLGQVSPVQAIGNLHFAASLQEAAHKAVALVSEGFSPEQVPPPTQGFLRGLFSGGTLAAETLLGLQDFVSPLYANIPVHPEQALENPLESKGHTILDLGEDVFTVGRLHPMMDNDLRIRRMRQEAEDPQVGLLLIDVVLGEGSHPDPAAELAPVIAEIRARRPLAVLAMVIGTDEDPQDKAAQIEKLESAGAVVFGNVEDCVANAVSRMVPTGAPEGAKVPHDELTVPFAAINVGLESFYDSLVGQGARAVHVDWRPPAGGNEKMMDILAKLKG